jgi:ATP-dependent DNA helicase RecQ
MTSIKDALKNYFGFDEFRPGQEDIIQSIVLGENVLAVLPTGAGKSLCYQLPALMSDGFSIVISPLIALMKDQVDSMNRVTGAADFINSTMDYREVESVLQNLAAGRKKLLYVAPERLENVAFADRIKSMNPEYIFVDEAHCISEWGHNFRPAYRKLKEFIDHTGATKVSAFTATATPEVIKDIVAQLALEKPRVFVRGFERDNLSVSVINTKNKRLKLLELLNQFGKPAIIYTASRKTTEEVNEFLQLNRVKSAYYHAGMHSIQRKHVQDSFLSGKLPVIVATNAFGMGIDKADIRTVIHYNMPGSIENYYQEIGRAGRDGNPSYAALLFEDRDEDIHNYFLLNSYPTKELIQDIYNALCDYGRIPQGETTNQEIPINYDYLRVITRKQDLTKALVQSSLRTLEEANYMSLVSEFAKRFEFRFTTDAINLKNFVTTTTDHRKKLFIVTLLRKYGNNAFQRKTNFSPAELAYDLDIQAETVHAMMNELGNSGVIDYSAPSFGEDTVRLLSPRVPPQRLQIDYDKQHRFFLHAKRKLETMKDFVYTGDCRFAFVLSYFGEDTKNYRCGRCDNCTTPQPLSNASLEYLHEIILKTIYEFEEGIPQANLFTILRGTSKSGKFKNTANFGVCANYQKSELSTVLFNLEQQGYIRLDEQRGKRLSNTNRGIELLKEKGLIQETELNKNYEKDIELFHLLREARKKAGERYNQAVYLICSDEILRNIILSKPATKLQLLSVEGFTERMFNKFGEDILTIVSNFIHPDTANRAVAGKELPETVQETYRMLKDGYSLKEISEVRRQSEPVISMQIESILEFEPGISVSKIIPETILHRVEQEYARGIKDLKSMKKIMGDTVSYPELRIALAKIKNG